MQCAGGGGSILETGDQVWVHAVGRGWERCLGDWGPGVGTCSIQEVGEVSQGLGSRCGACSMQGVGEVPWGLGSMCGYMHCARDGGGALETGVQVWVHVSCRGGALGTDGWMMREPTSS